MVAHLKQTRKLWLHLLVFLSSPKISFHSVKVFSANLLLTKCHAKEYNLKYTRKVVYRVRKPKSILLKFLLKNFLYLITDSKPIRLIPLIEKVTLDQSKCGVVYVINGACI